MRLQDKVIMITGGASGIGEASAWKLARAGAHVFICDIAREEGEALEAKIREEGGLASFLPCNVANDEDVEGVISRIIEEAGHIDVGFFNAGIEGPKGFVETLSVEAWMELFAINLHGLFFCARHLIPHMKRQGEGSIIITSSNLGQSTLPGFSAYSSVKGAAIMLGKALAVENRESGIRVNILCPGPVLTPLVKRRWEEIEDTREREQVREEILKIPNLIEPEDVADSVLFLASDSSKSYSGETFVLDQGARATLAE